MSKKYNLYLGQAGQAYAMSEFLKRGYNVAIPQVDVGDDIFVLEDENGLFSRIQVKTSKATPRRFGFSAKFNLSLNQLTRVTRPNLYYIFVIDHDFKWQSSIIINRFQLNTFYQNGSLGNPSNNRLVLYFSYLEDTQSLNCGANNFTQFIENYEDFPMITH